MPGKSADVNLTEWAVELKALYESGSANQFLLHGSVNDRMLVPDGHGGHAIGSLRDYLLKALMQPFDVVISYDAGNGIRVEKGGEIFSRWPRMKQQPELPKQPKQAIETLTHYFRYAANLARLGQESPHIGCILDAAEFIVPESAGGASYDTSAAVLLVRDWANDSLIKEHSIATFLIAENLNDLHPIVANNLHAAKINIPLPDASAIETALNLLSADYGAALREFSGRPNELSNQLVGATLSSVEQMVKTASYKEEPIKPESVVGLKRKMVEQDYGGLIGFIESKKTLDNIHGSEKIKEWLRQDIALWRQNDLKALPMGYLLCGPVGTGKTFMVECLAGEAGVPVVKMKNFRDKWVGSTEGNLEKIFRLLYALGRCIVFVDEADQALGRRTSSSGDSNVSGRVYSMIAEEMSRTANRGRIMWILASSRPDLIEVDLKRPGRVDVKIPLFPTLTPDEGFLLIQALCKRTGLNIPDSALPDIKDIIPGMLTPGAAEALAVKVYRLSRTQNKNEVDVLKECLENYQLPVPFDVMEFQIGLAVREASDLEFVPHALRARRDQAV